MTQTPIPRLYLVQLLESLPTDDQPWEDRLGLTFMTGATALLAGHHVEVSDNITSGVTLVIHLPTGAISWRRPRGEVKITPGPDNAARIHAYLDGQTGEAR